MSERAFQRLARHVKREYLRRGFSPKRAAYIGRATAGRVARAKRARKARRR